VRSPRSSLLRAAVALLIALGHAESASSADAAAPIAVCATTPDLGNLAAIVGGERVAVTAFTKPAEDPHFTPARPSFVKALNACELLILNGLEVEVGWLPVLLREARNAAVLPGARGHLDASTAITPMDVPIGTVDRSMGDVHPLGNPHYLLDPVNGLAVARAIRDRLATLRPADAAGFEQRYTAFRDRLATALVGTTLGAKYDVEKLMRLADHDRLDAFLREQGDGAALAGWLGMTRPYRGAKAVDDHPIWSYFARRFGLAVVAHLEPKPGVPPTTRHLDDVVRLMREAGVRLVLASAYYDPRHADFVARNTGAQVARMANLVGARPGTDDYLAMIDHDVREVARVLANPAP
jgi:zinc/manganese transport system substrate-binding protein